MLEEEVRQREKNLRSLKSRANTELAELRKSIHENGRVIEELQSRSPEIPDGVASEIQRADEQELKQFAVELEKRNADLQEWAQRETQATARAKEEECEYLRASIKRAHAEGEAAVRSARADFHTEIERARAELQDASEANREREHLLLSRQTAFRQRRLELGARLENLTTEAAELRGRLEGVRCRGEHDEKAMAGKIAQRLGHEGLALRKRRGLLSARASSLEERIEQMRSGAARLVEEAAADIGALSLCLEENQHVIESLERRVQANRARLAEDRAVRQDLESELRLARSEAKRLEVSNRATALEIERLDRLVGTRPSADAAATLTDAFVFIESKLENSFAAEQ
eukprot:gnl/Chilomastix_cuspidata/4130.p2 GENE.gnl/Chilomastix_cuspidata/4130~~gnl/Chilomastix_cuspidata/4130.p2  ORF type:complete len:370 (-),score=158.22 gnl/Chilomastix_cuspidata/4130:62-1099(-)